MASNNSDRRDKAVMALGIVAVLLFSANLLTAFANYFWPDHSLSQQSETTTIMVDEVSPAGLVIHGHSSGRKHIVIAGHQFAPQIEVDVAFEGDLEQKLAELEQRITLQAENLAQELSFTIESAEVESAMKAAQIALKRVEERLKAKEIELKERSDAQDVRNR